jgi:hypothetical protein
MLISFQEFFDITGFLLPNQVEDKLLGNDTRGI